MSLLQQRPQYTIPEIEQLAHTQYGLKASVKLLPSERDQNCLIRTDDGEQFVLKLANATESLSMLEMENAAMVHLNQRGINCPNVIPTKKGQLITAVSHHNRTHYLRLITFLSGNVWAKVKQTPALLSANGRLLANLTQALKDFDHPAAHREFHWDMQLAHKVIRQYLPLIPSQEDRALIEFFLTRFEQQVLPQLPEFRWNVIHNDTNDYNLLVDNGRFALLDFGDMVHSCTIFELAIGIAYTLLSTASEETSGAALRQNANIILKTYEEIWPLTAVEVQHLHTLIPIRWCTSVAIAAHQMAQEPDNPYLAVSQQGAWAALKQWRTTI